MKRLVILCLVLTAGPAAAQLPTDSSLALALRLVTEGQGDSARRLVRAHLASLSPQDSLYPEALFVAGSVAATGDSALAAYRRLSIEFSQSAWADRALLRIAQLRFAAGDHATAARSARRVLADYPLSPVLGEAAYWLARVQLEQGDLAGACTSLRAAQAAAGEDVELANRAGFYLQRCDAVAVTDSTPPDTVTTTRTTYAVQVGALGTAAAADELMRSVRVAGFEPRVYRDTDGLFKVRVGRFASRGDARPVLQALQRQLGGSPFIVEETR